MWIVDKILNYYGYYHSKRIHDGINFKTSLNVHRGKLNLNLLESFLDVRVSKYKLNNLEHDESRRLSAYGQEHAFWEHGYYEYWCEHNCEGTWVKYENNEYYIFAFDNVGDAGAFKMIST